MPFTLSNKGQVKYSAGEKGTFALLPQQEPPITTGEIIEERYRGNSVPFNARKITVGVLNNLRKKIDANKEPFALKKGQRQGPHDIVWIIKKNKQRPSGRGRCWKEGDDEIITKRSR